LYRIPSFPSAPSLQVDPPPLGAAFEPRGIEVLRERGGHENHGHRHSRQEKSGAEKFHEWNAPVRHRTGAAIQQVFWISSAAFKQLSYLPLLFVAA